MSLLRPQDLEPGHEDDDILKRLIPLLRRCFFDTENGINKIADRALEILNKIPLPALPSFELGNDSSDEKADRPKYNNLTPAEINKVDAKVLTVLILVIATILAVDNTIKHSDSHIHKVRNAVFEAIGRSGVDPYTFFTDQKYVSLLVDAGFGTLDEDDSSGLFFDYAYDGFSKCADPRIEKAKQQGYVKRREDYWKAVDVNWENTFSAAVFRALS